MDEVIGLTILSFLVKKPLFFTIFHQIIAVNDLNYSNYSKKTSLNYQYYHFNTIESNSLDFYFIKYSKLMIFLIFSFNTFNFLLYLAK